MLSCGKKDEEPPAEDTEAVTVSGKVQKGPYVQGTEITVRELDSSMTPTGNTFTGTIDDNTGSFSIKGKLSNKIVELSADGYYFNEVSGSLSSAKLTLSAVISRLQAAHTSLPTVKPAMRIFPQLYK
tara:strand:- start:34 stop:414 length:381 start_codon:yes stop_codon:yes gene_type:complete